MLPGGKVRWVFFATVGLAVATAGLMLGKSREGDYLSRLYARSDFTLLDDQGELFQLSQFPESRLLLLVFTPDAIHPAWVKPFRDFSLRLDDLKKIGIDVMMITRTNREIARNFKEAARFGSRLLVDTSGSVGRNLGIWPDMNPVSYWGYGLIDRRLQLYWAAKDSNPMSFEELLAELKKVAGKKNEKP